ncbi:MAG: 50S ribosomal protein L17 [Bdellovibrionaceae bacterium]|nr:50S ribosomal protein L17 [Pseudobdellovibrionaceae bacterium]|tara:strand:+ start:167 stop:718 length:552 start_codon:yes stop_codon:yes gene_type:complete
MRHNVDGRKLGRNTPHRAALLRNMANSVIQEEQVITTVAKAKEVRRVVDRLITLSKNGKPHAQRLAFDRTRDKEVVKKLFGTLSKRYENRAGGYTRVLKMSETRWGDGAEMALLELVDHPELKKGKLAKSPKESAAAPAVSDPFKGVRGIFGGTRKKSKAKQKEGAEEIARSLADAEAEAKKK